MKGIRVRKGRDRNEGDKGEKVTLFFKPIDTEPFYCLSKGGVFDSFQTKNSKNICKNEFIPPFNQDTYL